MAAKNKAHNPTGIASEIITKNSHEWLTEQYLPFAFYVIKDRALVGDDGLKPVNRRILYSMFKKGYTPNSEHLKAARAAADAVAYHPHGAASVEDALARMAQSFSLRVPLIDPHGSVGKVAGDTPAAARYWEARLTKAAMELLKELPLGAVEMGKNYDGKLDEPAMLPVRWPNSIINGSQGIAVGYASNMPAHNPDEIMDAARKLLKTPNLSTKQLMKIVKGPDMPSGGTLVGIEGVEQYFETGRGTFIIRARYTIEKMARGKERIIFYELPYLVDPKDIRNKISQAKAKGRFKEIALVQDQTDKKQGLRLVIETKSGTNTQALLNELFKGTFGLQEKFAVNSTILSDGHPRVVSMKDQILAFLEIRKNCILRKATVRIQKIDEKLQELNAILSVLVDIDKAIKILRESTTAEVAKTKLMKAFKISESQSEYILSMQLRKLTKSDSLLVKNEAKELNQEKKELEKVLKSEAALIDQVDKELLETKKVISSPRRTVVSTMTTEELKEEEATIAQAAIEESIDTNDYYVTRFSTGVLIKTKEPFSYSSRVKKYAHGPMIETIKFTGSDSIVVITDDGIGRKIPLSYLHENIASKNKDFGLKTTDKIVGIAKTSTHGNEVGIALGTLNGTVKISKTDFPNKDSFPVITLDNNDKVVNSRWLGKNIENTHFALVNASGNILVFKSDTIRAAGHKAGGVRGMKLKDPNDKVVSFDWVSQDKDVMVLSQTDKTLKLTAFSEIPLKNKGGMGVALHGFKKGETRINKAYVGRKVTLSLTEVNNIVLLPSLSKRAAKGIELHAESNMGTLEPDVM